MTKQSSMFPDERIRVFEDHWDVASKSEPGAWRTVTPDGACDCLAGVNGRLCWHVKLIRELGYLPENPVPVLDPPIFDIPVPGDMRWIWTARYANKRLIETELVPVQTSLGAPRFKTGYRIEWELPILAPDRGMMGLAYAQFKQSYLHKLERAGIDNIVAALQEISSESAGQPVCLMCFEDVRDPGQWCHRHILAEWLSGKLDIQVPELQELT